LEEKYRAFSWNVLSIDGHNIEHIVAACNQARATYAMPTVIIANTIPGKGVDFMENKYEWHGKPPNAEEAKIALLELRTLGGKIRGEHE
jgi:transketolase